MNRISRCDWLPQDGAILPARDTGFVPQGKFIMFWRFIPYNKSFIDQACSAKMAGYWSRSFFCVFMDLDFISVHKHAKKELGQYPAILTSRLVKNPCISLMLKIITKHKRLPRQQYINISWMESKLVFSLPHLTFCTVYTEI